MKEYVKKISPHYIAIGIGLLYALLICFHFFVPGYLRSLDYFFPLFGGILPAGSNGFVISVLSTLTQSILSPQIFEKIIIVLSFFVPFVGGIYLVKKSQSVWAMIFAGIAMTCNPYFYDRFMDGQLGMYLLFCVVPFWFISLLRFFTVNKRNIFVYLAPVLLSLLATSISMHAARFLLVSGIIFWVVFLDYKKILSYIGHSFLLAGFVLLANLYRIIPNMFASDGAKAAIDNFGSTDLHIFANYTPVMNNYITTLSLQGYRGEGSNRFVPSYGEQQYPFLIFGLLFGLIIVGIVYTIRSKNIHDRKLAWSLLIITILGYILGLGVSGGTIFVGMNNFLYDHMPLYAAMRESHKWVLLMVIGYAYFGAYGLHAIGMYLSGKKYHYTFVAISAIMLVIAYTPSVFLVAKYTPVADYPSERYRLRKELLSTIDNEESSCIGRSCYDMLVLPWHQYMHLSFVGKNVLNPAQMFFHPLRVLQGDNIEIGSLYSQSNNIVSDPIVQYLSSVDIISRPSVFDNTIDDEDFVDYLRTIGIKYIIVLKEVDYQNYLISIERLVDKKLISPSVDTQFYTTYKIDQIGDK